MIRTRLGEIVSGFYGNEVYRIYVITAGDVPLYVGRSQDAVTRVLSHLGTGAWTGFHGSGFDRQLKTFKGWKRFTVTLYTGDDAFVWAAARYPAYANIDRSSPVARTFYDSCVKDLEEYLIYELAPLYNSMGNNNHKKNSDNWERWEKLHPQPVEIIWLPKR